MTAHAAVVLAAGGSTRLGRPKQLLQRNGETLVHRAVRLAAATAPAQLLVVVGAEAPRVAEALHDCACTLVHHAAWQRGLASSLHAVASALDAGDGPLLVLGCDQPALEQAHLATLLEGAARQPAGIAATRNPGGAGIPAVVPRRWLDDLPTTGDHGFGARLRALPPGAVFLLEDDTLEHDLDTPGDVATAIARGWLDADGSTTFP